MRMSDERIERQGGGDRRRQFGDRQGGGAAVRPPGAALVLGARRERLLAELVEDIRREGGRALAVAGDVRDEAFAERLTATAVDEFGGLDIAFNNAGALGPLGPSLALTAPEWREVLETNLSSAYYGAKYQIPAMLARGAGSVIFTSTFVGHTAAFPGTAAYAAGKSGLIGLTQALAVEFGGRGIRVNALLPGGTDTAMGRQMSNTPEALAQVAELHALKRLAVPEEIAQAALYLASDASSFVTGTAMLVDGGVSIQRG